MENRFVGSDQKLYFVKTLPRMWLNMNNPRCQPGVSGQPPDLEGVSKGHPFFFLVALLDRILSGHRTGKNIIMVRPIQVIAWQSTDLIAINDVNLVKAVRFIRENSKRLIQVKDVVAVSGTLRRILQDRFRDALNRTVLEEIHRCRSQLISRMLADTDLTVSAIASAVGYENDVHLARFFSRNTSHTPSEYRRLHRKA